MEAGLYLRPDRRAEEDDEAYWGRQHASHREDQFKLRNWAIHIVVASKNLVKVNAARVAAEKCLSAFKLPAPVVRHEEAPSGVPDQPWGDRQTLLGARNRAAALLRRHPTSLVIAIEGGVGWSLAHDDPAAAATDPAQALVPPPLPPLPGGNQGTASTRPLECFAWAVVAQGSTGAEGVARSGSFLLPPDISSLVLQGKELGAADDAVFKRTKSGQGSGTVGHLTRGLLTRQLYYEQACALALIPFLNPEHYGTEYSLLQTKP